VITGSLSEKVLAIVYGLNTSQQAWTALATKFASRSKSRISNLKKQLQSLSQGPKSCADYLQSAKLLADQLNAAGNSKPEEEIITSILHGLNSSFTHFITTYSFHTRANKISFEDFQDELLSHELMLNQQQQEATDHSTFALTAQGSPQSLPFKGKTPLLIITGTHPHAIHNIVTQLQLEFPLKDLGALSFFLGIQVTRDASSLHVCQTKYITELLQKMIRAKYCIFGPLNLH
jgi:hypothetical protein